MKIAVVRGPSLNPWEMQNYLPLAKRHNLLLIGSKGREYEFESQVKTQKLRCLGEIFNFIPKGIEFLYRFFGDPQILLGFEKTIVGFDIVHTAECANYYSFQALKAREKGLVKKMVVTCWENLPGLHEDYLTQRRIKKEVICGADHFLAVTEQAKKALIADGAPEEKITVIPMGVDLSKFRPKPKLRKSSHAEFTSASKSEGILKQVQDDKNQRSKFTILFVGRLVEEKGVWDLLKAFRMVWKQVGDSVNLQLRMVGSGLLRDALIQQAREWGILEQVIFEDKSYSEMPKVYQDADLFVLPSILKKDWQEQFGMVLVEAMACGVPVVVTRTGAISEVVNGAGILVEPGDISRLAEAIILVVKDGKLQKSLSLKALKRVQDNYDCQKVALKIEKVYRKVLEEA